MAVNADEAFTGSMKTSTQRARAGRIDHFYGETEEGSKDVPNHGPKSGRSAGGGCLGAIAARPQIPTGYERNGDQRVPRLNTASGLGRSELQWPGSGQAQECKCIPFAHP